MSNFNLKGNKIFFILLRYISLIALAIPNLFLFYFIFTPLTVYPVFLFLKSAYDAVLFPGNVIFFKGFYASIIPACVAGAAYYLLLILNLTTPMRWKTRMKSLVFLFSSFLLLNIIRIMIFASLLQKGYQYFDLAHITIWYFGSTVFVILIWFANVIVFRIKAIPVYTDVFLLTKHIKSKKNAD